jgi:hypothetical protein
LLPPKVSMKLVSTSTTSSFKAIISSRSVHQPFMPLKVPTIHLSKESGSKLCLRSFADDGTYTRLHLRKPQQHANIRKGPFLCRKCGQKLFGHYYW